MKRAAIIEDEEGSRIVLERLLKTYCPEITVVGHADSVEKGITLLEQMMPQILFLDVHLVDGTGFELLEKCEKFDGAVIFTTAFDQYAMRAFRFSAIDYLLKPIDIEELKEAVTKATSTHPLSRASKEIEHLLSNLKRKPQDPPLLLVSSQDKIEFVRIHDIVRCEGQGSYSTIHLKDGQKITTSKVLKEYDLLLRDYLFYRVHQSHLVNLREVQHFVKAHSSIVMRDGKKIHVARRRKDGLIRTIQQLGH